MLQLSSGAHERSPQKEDPGMKSKVLVIAIMLAVVLFPHLAKAQQGFGVISGTVMDPAGLVVPGATVKITEISTGQTRTATSEGDGHYVLNAMKPSTYAVEVAVTGFKKFTQTGVVLEAKPESDA